MLRKRRSAGNNPFCVDVESGAVELNDATKKRLRFSIVCVCVLCVFWCISLMIFSEDHATQQDKCCNEALRNVYDFIGNFKDDVFYTRNKLCLCKQPLDHRVATRFYHRLQLAHTSTKCVVTLEFGISYCIGSFAVSETDYRIVVDPVVNSIGSSFYDVTEEYVSFDDKNKPKRISVSRRRPNSAVVSYVSDDGREMRHQQVFGLECQCILFLQEICSNATNKYVN